MRKYNWKKILVNSAWVIAGIGTIVLLGAAIRAKDQKKCADIRIEITGAERHMFIDEKDVLDMLNAGGVLEGSRLSALNLRSMETIVERNPWVKNAEMFIDNNRLLQVRLEERQPVARVFTLAGTSFYLDSGALRLPLSEKLSARVPIFTGFPSDREVLAKPDSLLLAGIVKLGRYMMADSFWMAQVAQVHITPQANFELVPVLGDHLVILGDADDLPGKFQRLFTFYREAWLQNGINTYEQLDVQYANQVVAVRKGTAKAMFDSAKAREIMQGLLASAKAGMEEGAVTEEMPAPAIVPPVKDTTRISPAMMPVKKPLNKPLIKTNSNNTNNNKTTAKALSKEIKTKAANKSQTGKKPAAKQNEPKAVMKRNK